MPSWKGQSRGTVLGYKIFVFTLKHLGLSFAYFILLFVAFYFFIVSTKSSKEIYFYYRKIHRYSWLRAVFSIYLNYYTFGKVLLDKFAILGGLKGKFTYNFDGENYLRQMVSEKTGGIIINAHIGNFEVAGQLLERLDSRIHIILMDAEHENIKKYISNVIVNNAVNMIPIRQDFSHIIPVSQAMMSKELIAIAGDRFVTDSKVVMVDFMGSKAAFPTGPFYLAARFDVPVTFAYAMKESKTHYHFYATPPVKVKKFDNHDEQEKELHRFVEIYAREFEKMVRKYPHQWFNYYSFWEKD